MNFYCKKLAPRSGLIQGKKYCILKCGTPQSICLSKLRSIFIYIFTYLSDWFLRRSHKYFSYLTEARIMVEGNKTELRGNPRLSHPHAPTRPPHKRPEKKPAAAGFELRASYQWRSYALKWKWKRYNKTLNGVNSWTFYSHGRARSDLPLYAVRPNHVVSLHMSGLCWSTDHHSFSGRSQSS